MTYARKSLVSLQHPVLPSLRAACAAHGYELSPCFLSELHLELLNARIDKLCMAGKRCSMASHISTDRPKGVHHFFQSPRIRMITHPKCSALLIACLIVGGCDTTRQQAIPIVLQTEKSDRVTLQIPRGYIEEPKKPEGVLVDVVLRISAKEFSGTAFAPDSEVRMQMEARSGKTDAARSRQASALIRVKWSEEAIVKSAEKSKKGLIAYSYPNTQEAAEGYYLTSSTGDVFVECRRSVCTAYKTWSKRVHLRIDFQPANAFDIAAVDAAVDGMLQSFATATEVAK